MKTFTPLILATLAVAAFAAESTDAVQIHQRVAHPIVKKVHLTKQHRAKIVASDLNEDDTDGGDLPPIGNPMGFDDVPPPNTKPFFDDSNAGSGSNNEDSSADGSGQDEDSSADGSNEDSSAEGSNEDSSAEGSGEDDSTTAPPAAKTLTLTTVSDVSTWELFDPESTSTEGSGGSHEADEESSGSGAEETEGSGSNGSGSNEETPDGPIGKTQGFDDEPGWGDVTGKGETKAEHEAKIHHEKKAALELAARASADHSALPFGIHGVKSWMMLGAAVGAAVGAVVAVLGVVYVRRQQQRDEQSTLAAELPEPQTGREDFEASESAEAAADELASSSIDLEEALTRDSHDESESEEDAEEGEFANSSTVV